MSMNPYIEIVKIHGPWISGSDSRAGPIWPYIETVLNLENRFYSIIHLYLKNLDK